MYDNAQLGLGNVQRACSTLSDRLDRDDADLQKEVVTACTMFVIEFQRLIVVAGEHLDDTNPVERDAAPMVACDKCGRTAPLSVAGMKCNSGGGKCPGVFGNG